MEHQIELTAEVLWEEVAGRLKGALNEATFGTWFAEARGAALTDDASAITGQNLVVDCGLTANWYILETLPDVGG